MQLDFHQFSSTPGESTTPELASRHDDSRWSNGSSRLHDVEEDIPDTLNTKEESGYHDGAETKRRRMHDESADQSVLVSDFVSESTETTVEGQTLLGNVEPVNFQAGAAANASTAEQMIEPTLVMFEV